MQLAAGERSVAIHILAIHNCRVVFVAPGARQVQTYDPIFLSGTAALVHF